MSEAALALGVGHELPRQDFERDLPFQIHVERTVDDTHAATADFLEDAIVRERLTDQRNFPSTGSRS